MKYHRGTYPLLCKILGGNISDTITVPGYGKTKEEANKYHEVKNEYLKERNKEQESRLNEEKKNKERQKGLIFLANPWKIEAILKIPAPENVHEVKSFCGMTQHFVAKSLNKPSDMLEPLRDLTMSNEGSYNGLRNVSAHLKLSRRKLFQHQSMYNMIQIKQTRAGYKVLGTIIKKPLCEEPKRLQRLLMRRKYKILN